MHYRLSLYVHSAVLFAIAQYNITACMKNVALRKIPVKPELPWRRYTLFERFLGDRLWNGSPYAIGPLSVCLSCLSVCNVGALWPNFWMDQDETCHAGMPRPWPHCVRRKPSSPSPKGHSPPIFGPYLLRTNDWMDQDATWYGAIGLGPGDFLLNGDPAAPPPKGGAANFRPMSIVAKQLDWSRRHLARRWALVQATLC